MPPEYGQQNVTFVEEQQLTRSRSGSVPGFSGMVKFLVVRGIAKNEAQANLLLLGIAGGALVVAAGVYWWSFAGGTPPLTPEELSKIQDVPGDPTAAPPPAPRGGAAPGTPTNPGDGFDPSLYQHAQ